MKQLLIIKLICLLTIFTPYIAFTQTGNLIPNSSFELYKVLPDDLTQANKCITSWKIPNTMGSAEYYHSNCVTKKAGTQKNHFGKQTPHTGKAYMGLCVTKRFRENLQVRLNHPLIKGKEYNITLFISCADKIGLSIVNEFNILFSKESFIIPGNQNLIESPKIKFTGKFNNKKEWTELSTTYIGDGTEQFMTFGSFSYIENGVTYGKISGITKYAHYYIDDISITLVSYDTFPIQAIITEEIPKLESIVNYNSGQTYVFDNLLFESGKSILLTREYPELKKLIHFLETQPKTRMLITGHTDNIGNTEFNKKLSYDRANALKLYLITKGINEDFISIQGKGDTLPLNSNDTEEGRKRNRRVEILVLE